MACTSIAALSDMATIHVNKEITELPEGPTQAPTDYGSLWVMSHNKRIGDRLAALRGKQTQEDLAAATGLSRSSIASIETGSQSIGMQSAITLADYFKVPLDYLLCRRVPPGGPLTGQFVEDRNILALIRFWAVSARRTVRPSSELSGSIPTKLFVNLVGSADRFLWTMMSV